MHNVCIMVNFHSFNFNLYSFYDMMLSCTEPSDSHKGRKDFLNCIVSFLAVTDQAGWPVRFKSICTLLSIDTMTCMYVCV
jgi:hypothetical protein